MTVQHTLRIARASAFLTAFSLVTLLIPGCSGTSSSASRNDGSASAGSPPGAVIAAERLRLPAPGRMVLEALEGPIDTVEFHIGSPLFMRLRVGETNACTPGVGEFFHFDATGAQMGWGFQEVTDTLLFPSVSERCERVVMLSSEASNRLAQGRYTMRTELFLDPEHKLRSDTVWLHPVRSASGADEVSYARFLMEQIIRNAAQLRDPQTVAALFGEGVPTSAESEVYRAVVQYRIGDFAGAAISLQSSREMERERRRSISLAAAATRTKLERILAQMLEKR